MNFLVLQHHDAEGLGNIAKWLNQKKFSWHICTLSCDLPDSFYDYDGLIILGGPMHLDETNHRLGQELLAIEHFIALQKPILGICLGAQMVAFSLGANIMPMQHAENGWHLVTLGCGKQLTVAQWHEQQCSLPEGADLIASSDQCLVQMFRFKHFILATQFHPEWDNHSINRLKMAFGEQCPLTNISNNQQRTLQMWWFKQLSQWLDCYFAK